MNAQDVLKYGHLWVLKHVDGLNDEQWMAPDVCGFWSTKDIVAHLASFECVLVEVLQSFLGDGATPTLDQMLQMDGDAFNAAQVGQRQNLTPGEALAEYTAQAEIALGLLPRLDITILRQPGLLPWYGSEYSIDDWIVYQFYGHKREHMAQVAVYRDSLKPSGF
jgi:hypothetical protein